MEPTKRLKYQAFIIYALIAILTDTARSQKVDTDPPSVVLLEGEQTSLLCRSGRQLEYCRIQIPGERVLSLSPKWENPGFSYYGAGFDAGQCGVTIPNVSARNHGKVKCYLGFQIEEDEGIIDLIVALAPLRTELDIITESRNGAYDVDQPFKAKCISRDGRPAANLTWYMDGEPIIQGLGIQEIVESLDNRNTTLFTSTQEIQRYLSASDDGKSLVCRATHLADRGEANEAKVLLRVKYRPQPLPDIKVYGLTLDTKADISVIIQSNPKPQTEWTVAGMTILPGSPKGRYEAHEPIDIGNGEYNISLSIFGLTLEDTHNDYYLRAANEFGSQNYTIRISSLNKPAVTGISIGAIVGIIVVAVVFLIVIVLVIFARVTARWCFRGASLNTDIGPDSEAQINPHQNDDFDGKEYIGDEHIDTTLAGDETPPVTDKLDQEAKNELKKSVNGQHNGKDVKTNTPV